MITIRTLKDLRSELCLLVFGPLHYYNSGIILINAAARSAEGPRVGFYLIQIWVCQYILCVPILHYWQDILNCCIQTHKLADYLRITTTVKSDLAGTLVIQPRQITTVHMRDIATIYITYIFSHPRRNAFSQYNINTRNGGGGGICRWYVLIKQCEYQNLTSIIAEPVYNGCWASVHWNLIDTRTPESTCIVHCNTTGKS